MAKRGSQNIRILKGINLDLSKEKIKDQATFLKNATSDYNKSGSTGSDGQNHNVSVLTPILSNIASAEFSGVKCCWDFSMFYGLTIPLQFITINVDGTDQNFYPQADIDTIGEMLTYLNTLSLDTFIQSGNSICVTDGDHDYGFFSIFEVSETCYDVAPYLPIINNDVWDLFYLIPSGDSAGGGNPSTPVELAEDINNVSDLNFSVDENNFICSSFPDTLFGNLLFYEGLSVRVTIPPIYSGDVIFSAPMACTPFGDGVNLTIGSKYDKKLNQMFWFVWNSNDEHQVWVYDAATNLSTKVLQTSVLNFSPKYLITSIDVVIANVSTTSVNVETSSRLLYWTDGYNPPRKINVDTAIANGYTAVTFMQSTDQYMQAVKYQPYYRPSLTNTITNPDTSFKLNFVYKKQMQFRYRFYYDDGEHSRWSMISSFYFSYSDLRNFVEVTMEAGTSLVTFIEIGVRFSNIDYWLAYETIPRSVITANVLYAYSNITNLFKYTFYNNKEFTLLDQNDTNVECDLLPLKAGAQKFVEGNLLLYGDNLEGFNNLSQALQETPTIAATYYNYATQNGTTLTLSISLLFLWTGGTIPVRVRKIDFATGVDSIIDTHNITLISFSPLVYSVAITPIGVGDIVYLQVVSGGTGQISNLSTVVGTYTNSTFPTWNGGGANFSLKKTTNQVANVTAHITFETIIYDNLLTWSLVDSQDTVPPSATAVAQLMQGGKYSYGFIMYHASGYVSFVQHSTNLDLSIQSIQQANAYQLHKIIVSWNGIVFPSDVYAVSVCRTKELTVTRILGTGYLQCAIFDIAYLQANGQVGTVGTDEIVKVRFNINFLIQYNQTYYNNTTTTYTWTKGDRIQFIRNGLGTILDIATYGLLDFELSTDPAAPDVGFIIDYSPTFPTVLSSQGAMAKLYTPATSPPTNQFYEISDRIKTIINDDGETVMPTATTTLSTFDTYPVVYKIPTVFSGLVNIPFEHHSIYSQGVVPSNGEDIGRVNAINVDAVEQWYDSDIRKSNVFLRNGKYNGLATFDDNEGDRTTLNKEDGAISQLESNGFNLFVLQQNNCCRIMMAKQLVTLADGGSQLVATEKFFSDPILVEGDFGCQNGESFQSLGSKMFWVDTQRAAVCMSDWQKVIDIAREGMVKSYFERKLKYVYDYNQGEDSDTDFFIIPAGIDPKHNEYVISFFNINIGDSIVMNDTGSLVNMMLRGATMENMFIVSHSSTYYDIFTTAFYNNVVALKLYYIINAGATVNHYVVYYDGDVIDGTPPTANAGWNCTLGTCNSNVNCGVAYPVSFFTYGLKWAKAIGLKVVLNCNINTFGLTAYTYTLAYTQSQCGLVGVVLAQEYSDPSWCQSPLSGNTAGIVSACTTLSNALQPTYPSIPFVTDWRPEFATTPVNNAYTDEMLTIPNITGGKFYMSENQLILQSDLAGGRTAQQYLLSINTGIDITLPNRVTDYLAYTSGLKMSVTQMYTEDSTGFGGTFLQSYFFARLYCKLIQIEAEQTCLDMVALARFDNIDARTTLNINGEVYKLFANFFTNTNKIYTLTLPVGMYGIASNLNSTNHGYAIIINSTSSPLTQTDFTVVSGMSSASRPFLTITSIHASALDGVATKETLTQIPMYSINLVTY